MRCCYQLSMVGADDIRTRLQTGLRAAIKARDTVAASALRSALGAIGNAEAVPQRPDPGKSSPAPGGHQPIAGSAGVLGAGEVRRRALTKDEVAEIVRAEVAQRHAAASRYEAAGHADRASRLRREAEVIASAARFAKGKWF